MSSFCTAKATHIFSAKKFQHIYVSLDVNFKESLTNDVVSFEQLGPGEVHINPFPKDHIFIHLQGVGLFESTSAPLETSPIFQF